MAPYRRWANIPRRRRARVAPADGRLPAGCEVVHYEGYGPGGAAVLVDCVTADPSGLRERVRSAFARHGGRLGAPGAVRYLFNTVGLLSYPPGTGGERLAQVAFDAGAEEVLPGNEAQGPEVLTDPVDLASVRERLAGQGLAPAAAEVTERAWDAVAVSGEDARCMLHLLGALESLEDVRNVYSNAEIPEEIVAEL
jgi:transcriptional/translational regulatory protein YebC/TACO1